MAARIAPAAPPFPPEIQARLDRIMPPGVPPLSLFTTLARDACLFERFMSGGLLDRGNLTLRQREIVISRTSALCRTEYEWGVHAAFFAEKVGFDAAQLRSLVHGSSADPCWPAEEQILLEACDALHRTCDLDDAMWGKLRASFSEMAIIEILMLAGFYHMVGYLTNALRLPLEPFATRFPR